MKATDFKMPEAPEAQAAAIATAILDPDYARWLVDELSFSDFLGTADQGYFKAIERCVRAGQVPDLVAVVSQQKQSGSLGDGSAARLAEYLGTFVVDPWQAARIVKDRAAERRYLVKFSKASEAAKAGDFTEALRLADEARAELSGASPKRESRFKLVNAGDLATRPISWLIDGLVEENTLALIFGDPGTWKTFLAIAWACCCASKTAFLGHQIKNSGPVVYLCGEGQNGIARRIKAWCIRHGVDMATLPLFVSTVPAGLCDPEQLQSVLSAIDAVAKEHGNPVLIVVDTLARNFGPGDENSTSDMSGFVAALDRLRTAYNAAIAAVHHTGHGNKERSRGAMALRAAVDAEYRLDVDQEGVVRMVATKMKDATLPEPMAFRPAVVELGMVDDEGRPVTSIILDATDYEPPARTGHEGKGKWQRTAFDVLLQLYEAQKQNLRCQGFSDDTARVTVEDWRRACLDRGMNREAWRRIKDAPPEGVIIDHGFAEIRDVTQCHVTF